MIGDFQLHLQTVQHMHPFFAASGHNNYTKSIQVYLQDMESLADTHPAVNEYFTNGNFVTRRSNRLWAGLPDDLIIEQVQKSIFLHLPTIVKKENAVKK